MAKAVDTRSMETRKGVIAKLAKVKATDAIQTGIELTLTDFVPRPTETDDQAAERLIQELIKLLKE